MTAKQTKGIAHTKTYKEMSQYERSFARAAHYQPEVVEVINQEYGHFSVKSVSEPDESYWVRIPDGDITKADCHCQWSEHTKNDNTKPCVHKAAAWYAYWKVYERLAAGETLAAIMHDIKVQQGLASPVLPQQCQHCHKDLTQLEVELNMTECKRCLDETLVA